MCLVWCNPSFYQLVSYCKRSHVNRRVGTTLSTNRNATPGSPTSPIVKAEVWRRGFQWEARSPRRTAAQTGLLHCMCASWWYAKWSGGATMACEVPASHLSIVRVCARFRSYQLSAEWQLSAGCQIKTHCNSKVWLTSIIPRHMLGSLSVDQETLTHTQEENFVTSGTHHAIGRCRLGSFLQSS